jgi:hypothetical protein
MYIWKTAAELTHVIGSFQDDDYFLPRQRLSIVHSRTIHRKDSSCALTLRLRGVARPKCGARGDDAANALATLGKIIGTRRNKGPSVSASVQLM